jgi:hypothetical protein
VPGVDSIDYQFKLHDQAYRDPARTPRSKRDADFNLVKGLLRVSPRVRLIDVAFGKRPAVGSIFKFFAVNFFTVSGAVRSAHL